MEENQKEKVDLLPNSVKDAQKVELHISHDNDNVEEGSISIMNVFSYMRKRAHIYIWLMIIGLILGLIVPFLMYETKEESAGAVAIIGFNYDGADANLAPDGSKLDVSYIKSSYIIQNALNKANLSKNLQVESIANNIVVTGVLTDDSQQQIEILQKLADADDKYLQLLQGVTLNYRSQYIIVLNNGFKNGNKKITINDSDLSHLLMAITSSYMEYFNEEYKDSTLPKNTIEALNFENLDYLESLDQLKTSLNYLQGYCSSNVNAIPNFRGSDGLNFNDLYNIVANVNSSNIDYIYSYVYLNNISKNYHTLLTNLKYELRQANLDLAEVEANITTVETSITNYEADKIVVSSSESGTSQTTTTTSDYYNDLITKQVALYEEKSSLKEQISILNAKITQAEGTPATAEEVAKADEYVDGAIANVKDCYELVKEHAEELFASSAYKNTFIDVIHTNEEGSSITSYAKKILIGAVAGVFIGFAAWGIDGLVLEFKHSKKNEEDLA